MGREQIKGTLDKLAGQAQGAAGEWLDDEQLRLQGAARQAAGQLQQRYGQLLDNAAASVCRQPLTTVAVLAGAGLLLGLLLRRR